MPRPFFETLRELRKGKTLEDLTFALSEMVTAVQSTGKGGEIVLRLRIRPPRKGSLSYITIEDEVVTKAPRADRGDTVFFPLADGSLSRQDPSQLGLKLTPVPDEVVDPETGEIIQQRSS